MKRKEKKELIRWANSLSDAELEKAYYSSVLECLGSEAEEMYERGYDLRDIEEREKYEKFLMERADVLDALCEERGITLWDDTGKEQSNGRS